MCEADPRSINERRADALKAAVTHTALVCGCGQSDCPGPAHDKPAKNAVVYVVADEKSVDAAQTSSESGADPAPAPPAFVFGAGVLPTALLGGILERARIREVRHPGSHTPPEPRYTPTRQTCEFVRCRDLTCRFPGCDKPAQFCDVDHTVAYPVGPTHPSNLKCLCRFHHLMKAFWGWRDQQLPDGTGNHSGYSPLNLPLPAPTPSGAGPVPIRGTGAKAALAGGVIGAACGVRAAATYRPRRRRRVCIDSIRTLSGQLECSALHCIGGRKPLASPSVLPEIQVRPPEHRMVQK